jgi:CRISPR type III-A-associated protein Csm2
VTSTQLRRFYTKAKTAEGRLKAGEPFSSVTASILELKQHAANAVGRAQGRNEEAGLKLLKQFIDRNVELASKSEKAFLKGFLPHFQGVVAYFKFHYPKK